MRRGQWRARKCWLTPEEAATRLDLIALRDMVGPTVTVYELWRRLSNGQYHMTLMHTDGRSIREGYYRADGTPVGTALARRTP